MHDQTFGRKQGMKFWVGATYNPRGIFISHPSSPYRTLKAEISEEAWESVNSDTSRPFKKPESGRIAVKVINQLGDEVMKVFRV